MQNRSLMKILFALLLVGLILFSFFAFIQKQKRSSNIVDFNKNILGEIDPDSKRLLAFPSLVSYFPVSTYLVEFEPIENNYQSQLLNNSTRSQIFDFIKANPGVSFRGLCSSLGIAVGSAQFHLGVLKKAGLISFFRDGKYKRFFEVNKFTWEKKELISLLKHDTVRKIVEILLGERNISHSALASTLNISSQGLTWNMNRLRKTGIIQEIRNESRVYYFLDPNVVLLLSDLKSNQIDTIC
jgi:DNA-binding transcriptional ArsR family regulator